MPPFDLAVDIVEWPLVRPFAITGYRLERQRMVQVRLSAEGCTGNSEAAAIFYLGETAESVVAQIRALTPRLHTDLSHLTLYDLLPPGGARNAVDCALWSWQAARTGKSVSRLLGEAPPQPVRTAFTIGLEDPGETGRIAAGLTAARIIKLKLDGTALDGDRIRAARASRPDVELFVDANQGWSLGILERMLPLLEEQDVRLIEQPLPRGAESKLDGLNYPIPLAADESFLDISDLVNVIGRFSIVSIKLDKCGGLTRAFDIIPVARAHGFRLMVGNMGGSSLAMVPHYLVAQHCDYVDLDGPTLLSADYQPSMTYRDGMAECHDPLWTDLSPSLQTKDGIK